MISRRTGGSWAAVYATAALALCACGGGGDGEASGLPDCAGVDETIDHPAALPESFPVPEGTVFVEERASGDFTLVEARAPGTLSEVRKDFEQKLEEGGYRILESEAESFEAEAEFAGEDVEGRFVLHELDDCNGALRVGLTVR